MVTTTTLASDRLQQMRILIMKQLQALAIDKSWKKKL
jgi:hypothetical protein